MAKKRSKLAERKVKFYSYLFAFFGGAVLLLTVLNVITPSRSFSKKENRSLQKHPIPSVASLGDGSYFSDMDSYYSDQFVFRDMWMSMSSFGKRAIGQKENGNVYFGKGGYLLGKPCAFDAEASKKTEHAINSFASRHQDLHFYMMVVPSAANILPKKLPALTKVADQAQDIRAFESGIRGVTMLDATGILEEHKNEEIFYKTDHHWTSEGAFAVFSETASKMEISPISYERHPVSVRFQGTLASKSGYWGSKDVISVYEPKGSDVEYIVYYPDSATKKATMFEAEKLKEKDQYTVFFGGNYPLVEIKTTAASERSLLVFKDSYANSYMQFLFPYYKSIVMVDPRYYYDNIETSMKSYGITDVLFLYSGDTLSADTNLADTLSAGAS